MTPQEIRDAIAASPTLQALQADGRINAIASALSSGRTKVVSHFASERGILERYPGGPIEADALLSKLETFSQTAHPMASIVKRALKFLAQPEGLDIGSPAVQALLAQMSGSVLTTEEVAGLREMATVPNPLTTSEVEAAIRGA